ncbi:MAG TPA: FAD-dependent oxidoreductase [Candidatus Omnitrophota bacterium]|nr:FAD-dependent oxidoreductase [Candidatus Omnitrophota bacterium]
MPISIFSSKILGIRDLADSVKHVKLSAPSDFEFKAGQYLSLSVINDKGQKIRKPFSIVNEPADKKKIEFCIKIIPGGVASEFVKKLKKGDKVELFGPAGKFTANSPDKDLIFICAGVGIAPFMSIIPDLLNKEFKKRIILLKSARTEKDALYEKELGKLAEKHPNFRFYNIFSNPQMKESNKGYVQDFLGKYIPENFNGNFYVCGFKEMVNDAKLRLQMNFQDRQIFTEKFD